MRKVREGLFLGDIIDCIAVLQTPESNITHMLSVFADELLTSDQNFAPGNLCSLCVFGSSDDGPGAPIARIPKPEVPLLTIPTGEPTNPQCLDNTGKRPEVSQDGFTKAESSSREGGTGSTEVGQDATKHEEGNGKAVESPQGRSGTEVSPDAMAEDERNGKAVEFPVGGGFEVLRDAMENDDGNVKVLESPVGNGTGMSLRDSIASDDGNAKAVESSSGGAGTELGGGGQIINNKQGAVVAKRKLVRKTVPLRDMDSENLLDHLEVCLEFVGTGRACGGAVLVHCLAGISRSASVITAYLMRTEKLSLIQALASLREVSGGVRPNDGFMMQLRMFEEMGCRVDKESPTYKQFQDTTLAQGAGCTPGLSWLSFLEHANSTNRVQKEDSFRLPSFIKRVYNAARPIKDKAEENKVSADIPLSGVSSFRFRIGRLCGRGF